MPPLQQRIRSAEVCANEPETFGIPAADPAPGIMEFVAGRPPPAGIFRRRLFQRSGRIALTTTLRELAGLWRGWSQKNRRWIFTGLDQPIFLHRTDEKTERLGGGESNSHGSFPESLRSSSTARRNGEFPAA